MTLSNPKYIVVAQESLASFDAKMGDLCQRHPDGYFTKVAFGKVADMLWLARVMNAAEVENNGASQSAVSQMAISPRSLLVRWQTCSGWLEL